MRLIRTLLLWVFLAAAPAVGWCAQTAGAEAAAKPAEATASAVKEGEKGLPAAAETVFHIGPLPVTNSMLVTWIVAAGLIIFARLATRRIEAVPRGIQNFWEWLVESLHEFLEGIIGPELVKRTFWFFATVFIFILFTNWFGLIPGVGTLFIKTDHGMQPLLRGGNADLNMTLAMSLIFFACWIVWAVQANGIKGAFLHVFGPKGDSTGVLRLLMIGVFFLVGFLEVFSILFRPVSLSFRLYGNIFAGENMLEAMAHLIPALSWLIPVPFYFMELLVGLVQALVFMLLTAVFTMLICLDEEGRMGGHH